MPPRAREAAADRSEAEPQERLLLPHLQRVAWPPRKPLEEERRQRE